MIKKITLTPLLIIASLLLSAVSRIWESAPEAASQTTVWPDAAWLPDTAFQAFLAEYEAYLRDAREADPVPGLALAVVRNGQLQYAGGFGLRDVETRLPVDEHTVFRLASLSKGFAPVLTGILVDDGCLHWDDRVVDYLPWFCLSEEGQSDILSLRHVLSHTTGLPRHTYSNLLNMGVAYADILPRLSTVPLAHPVGSIYNYQNVAYSLIGDVIESATDRSYGELLRERVFLPAGMYDASTTYEAMLTGDNVAMPHNPHQGGYHRVALDPNYYEVGPAAGVNASAADMAQWLLLMMGERPDVLSSDALMEICTPQVAVSKRERNFRGWRGLESAWYGLGWRVLDWRGRRLVYHGGYVRGYRTEIAFDPEEQVGMVLLANGPGHFLSDAVQRFFAMYAERFPKQPEEIL